MRVFLGRSTKLFLAVFYLGVCPLMAGEYPQNSEERSKDEYEMIPTGDETLATLPKGPGLSIGDVVTNLPDHRKLAFVASLVSVGAGLGIFAFQNAWVSRNCPIDNNPGCVVAMITLIGVEFSLMAWPFFPGFTATKRVLAYLNLLPESALIKVIGTRNAHELLTEKDLKACGTAMVKIMPSVLNKLSESQARQLLKHAQNYREWLEASGKEAEPEDA